MYNNKIVASVIPCWTQAFQIKMYSES